MIDKPVVLIVDDAPANLHTLASCLKDQYHIKVATNGELCLELAQAEPVPDLILLDIVMPGMDGYEVCQKLKQDANTASIPVVFVTGMDNEDDEENGLRIGAVDYITKPIRPAIVKARVKTHITLKQQRDLWASMAMRDQLTGLFNRHYLMEEAEQKVAWSLRHQQPLSVLLLDIDRFKSVNDSFGHAVGDKVLQSVATALQKVCRREDTVARLGGEEFVVLLDQCDITMAGKKAQQARELIEGLKLEPMDLQITTSIGVAQLDDDGEEDFKSCLNRADQALYQAKEQGRNRVVIASD